MAAKKTPPAWLSAVGKFFKSAKTKKVMGIIGKTMLSIGLVLVLTGCIVACVLTVFIATNFTDQSNLPDVESINKNQTSIIMAYNSETGEYEEYSRISGIRRIFTPLDEMPQNMRDAIVAIEDERFYTHYGVDWKRTISAFANLLLHFNSTEYGGSTLTQQLIKVMTGNDDHSVQRKITEILSAVEMEKLYSKEEILQAYLNMMPLSNNVTGVGAGANYIFGVDAKDLTLAQCAALAAITNNPVKYNPYRYPENLRTRQRTVLYKMYELKFITKDEYEQALGEQLYFKSSAKEEEVYDWYTDMVIDDVIDELMSQYGYSESQAQNTVFYGGLTIYSCVDPKIQQKVEAVYADESNYPDALQTDTVAPQAALYVMDYTGKTVAVVGGRGEKTANRLLNRATSSLRQPGSAMKPLTVYSPALQNNLIHYSSAVPDCYITLPNGTKWPKNYNQSVPTDSGMTTVDVAVEKSMNTVAAQLMVQITPQEAFKYLKNSLGITSLVEAGEGTSDIDYAPMALGGLTNGVYPREIAAAYQIFGNGGYYNKPYTFTKVEQKGKVILQHSSTRIQVLDTDSAYIMNRLLQNVVTNGSASSIKGDWTEWEVFAKTGTTQQSNDVWLVGGTSQYVAASWFGYDQNQKLVSGQTSAARKLWSKAMAAIHEDLEPTAFTHTGTTVEKEFCTESGLLAGDRCTKTKIGVYKPNYLPDVCDKHTGASSETPALPPETE